MRNFAALVGSVFLLSLASGQGTPASAPAQKEVPAPGNRQKTIDDLLPLVKKTGDPKLGQAVFTKQCASCHVRGNEGKKVGPDLTGMSLHPKSDLLIRIVDPNRNAEGKYQLYHVTLLNRGIVTGILVSESKASLTLIDAQAKKHTVSREDIDTLVVTTESLMPDDYAKTLKPEELVNLLEFLTAHGKYLPLPLGQAATIVSTRGMFNSKDADERLIFEDWGPKTFKGVPFQLVDPQGDSVPNVILLHGPMGKVSSAMPKSVRLPCNTSVKEIHLLSGVSGWGYPFNNNKKGAAKNGVVLTVRLHYADGQTENHDLRNGVHFADYIKRNDVPGSEFAFALRSQQMRYLAVQPKRDEVITEIEFVKGPDQSAPIIMAVTVEPR